MKIGDYVRTKKGIKRIYKIDNNKTKWKYLFKLKEQDGDGCIDLGYLCDDDIIKSSPNIIDLIEIGDIITFKDDYVVYNVIALPDKEVGLDIFYLAKTYDGETEDISISKEQMEKYIKSIVTKEQFESMEYRLGGI